MFFLNVCLRCGRHDVDMMRLITCWLSSTEPAGPQKSISLRNWEKKCAKFPLEESFWAHSDSCIFFFFFFLFLLKKKCFYFFSYLDILRGNKIFLKISKKNSPSFFHAVKKLEEIPQKKKKKIVNTKRKLVKNIFSRLNKRNKFFMRKFNFKLSKKIFFHCFTHENIFNIDKMEQQKKKILFSWSFFPNSLTQEKKVSCVRNFSSWVKKTFSCISLDIKFVF